MTIFKFSTVLPYLEHSSVEIRSAAVQSLCRLFNGCKFSRNFSHENQEILIFSLRALIQCLVLEPKLELRNEIHRCWKNLVASIDAQLLVDLVCPFLGIWLSFSMVTDGNPRINADLIFFLSKKESHSCVIGSDELLSLPIEKRSPFVVNARFHAVEMISELLTPIFHAVDRKNCFDSPSESLENLLLVHLSSNSAWQKISVALLVAFWASNSRGLQEIPYNRVVESILRQLTDQKPPAYDESLSILSDANSTCKEFISNLGENYAQMNEFQSPLQLIECCRNIMEKKMPKLLNFLHLISLP